MLTEKNAFVLKHKRESACVSSDPKRFKGHVPGAVLFFCLQATNKKELEPQPVRTNAAESLSDGVGAVVERTPDDYDELGDDLSRALGGVRGYDLDALDLEMDDLGPEDLEVLFF